VHPFSVLHESLTRRVINVNLVNFLKIRADKFGKKTLLFGEEHAISYRAFDEITDRMAYGLHKIGVKPGDHVAVFHPNSPQVLLSYYSIIKAGGVVIPINPVYTPPEVKFVLNDSETKYLIACEDLMPGIETIKDQIPLVKNIINRKLNETVENAIQRMVGSPPAITREATLKPEDPAMVIYTSGSTGRPKGVVLTHRNFCFEGPSIARSHCVRGDDIAIGALPMVHIFSIAGTFFAALSAGGSMVVLEKFQTRPFFEAVAKYKATWFTAVPTMFIYLLSGLEENKRDISSLRMAVSGGASLPVETLRNFEDKFGAEIYEGYGLTESSGCVTGSPVYGVRKPGSVGVTISGVAAKVVGKAGNELPPGKVGELIFKGPNATSQYFKLPEETKEKIENGWVYTGDHARIDDEGYFYIVGREKELIISGGYNIYPREIEEVLQKHPGINEVAVIGIPDPAKGEIPKAFVSLKPRFKVTESELMTHCKENLASYKIPNIVFLNELPKSVTGKIMKSQLPRE
jgi:long-chain acyl-CoA synthetase